MKIEVGMRFKMIKTNNELINTKVGNIVEVVKTNEVGSEMKDILTHDWFYIENDEISQFMKRVNKK